MGKIAGIVLCAGQGKRMRSERSKLLHHVAGVPLCCWPIGRISSIADNDVVAVVGFQAEEVQDAVRERFGSHVKFALQTTQRGTGDAVRVGMSQIADDVSTIVVIGGDTPLLKEDTLRTLLDAKRASEAKVAMFVATQEVPTGYGRIVRDSDGLVTAIVEERDANEEQRKIKEVNPAIYAFDALFLREEILKIDDINAQNELYLTDLIQIARANYGAKSIVTCPIGAEEVAGINDRIQLAEAESSMRKRLAQHWMKNGVTMIDPATTYIDAEVELSCDVTLHPNVMLRGRTRIEKNVSIGMGCVISNSVVEAGAQILSHSVLENATVGQGAKVGPFARLRPGAVLEEDTRVGNFVEVKKTLMKRGAKASHLAYLGDAEIGENCNIGAGTITCNYDGFGKHLTKIGDGAFIGSNSTLVAPVEIGDLAYVGAGSTVTKDVPPDALAVSRARQENKLDYAARIRDRLKAKT